MFNIVFAFEHGNVSSIFDSFGFDTRNYVVSGDPFEKILMKWLQEVWIQKKETKSEMKIMVSRSSEVCFFKPEEIVYIEALGNRKCIRGTGKSFEFYSEMYSLEKITEPMGFVRIHHSYIISLRHLDASDSRRVMLDNGTALNIGKAYRGKFREALQSYPFHRLN